MNAKEARSLAVEKLIQYCERLIHENAENFQAKTIVTLNSRWDVGIVKDAVKSLIHRGYKVEEVVGCYLNIEW